MHAEYFALIQLPYKYSYIVQTHVISSTYFIVNFSNTPRHGCNMTHVKSTTSKFQKVWAYQLPGNILHTKSFRFRVMMVMKCVLGKILDISLFQN